MQGNRDVSWSATGGSGRGNGGVNGGVNGVPGGYRPQTTPVFSNFNLQQPISYPLTQFPANFFRPNFPYLSSFSLGNANFQTHQNLNFHHPQIPHQFGAGANVFLQPHGQSFSFTPQPPLPNNDISGPQNRGASGALESSSLKRRRQEVVHGSDVVVKDTPKSIFASGESANSFSVSLPIPPTRLGTDDSGGSRIHGGNRSLEKCSAKPKRKVEVARIDKAVNKTRKAVVAAGESVSSTRVSRSVLEELEAESWRSLGVQMQDVPSLRQLMALEGKINAFIHCFVGARRIVTLHDLEVAICRNEFVDSFNDLELGPLLQHPLVLLYFPSISSSTTPVQITSEEIISLLDSYLYTYHKDDVKLDEFLNFVAEKKSVTSKEKLGVRIQSLRMYISFILDAKRQEGETFKILLTELHQKYHFSSSKKQRQDKSLTVSERADSFALHHKDYCGKHIRFYSSDSDDNDSVDYEVENLYSSDNISSCPYPSVAEEMKRLGGSNKKRKAESCNYEKSDSSKLLGRGSSKLQKGNAKQEIPKSADVSDAKQVFNVNEADFTLSEGALRLFISTWKDTCKELSISTFVEKMLSFYDLGGIDVRAQNKRAKVMSSFPFVGLLNVAVTSMRRGMWDSIYDNLQMTSQSDTTNPGSGSQVGDIKPSEIRELNKAQHSGPPKDSNTVEEIIRRLSLYFKHDLSGEKPISIFRKLQTCEVVLAEQFQVQDFVSLGWGGFCAFLENHMLLLPIQLKRFLAGELREECPLEVHVNQNLLSLLLSQASEFSGGNVTSIQMLVQLLTDQFPSINFKVEGNDLEEKFTEIIDRYKKKSGSKCVLYSATLLGAENSLTRKHLEEHPAVGNDTESRSSPLTAISSKEIVDVFLSVPLLSDLKSWCHWDLRFAPQFGPLMRYLNEINSKDLLCLVTRDGKIIRTDPSATADSFLEAALQGSAYRTAAQLLSVISLNGRTHLPFSLLKCYAKRAFEVFLDNHSKEMELNDRNTLVHMRGPVNLSASLDKMIVSQQKTKVDKSDYAASKFLLDCLGYLPGEFRSLAVDILLSGLRSVVKDAPTRVLSACELTEQRIMLHDTGLLLGVVEWINDYHEFCSSPSPNSAIGENDPSNLDSGAGFVQKEIIHTEQRSMNVSEKSCDYKKGPHESCHTFNCSGASCDSVKESVIHSVPEFHDNPAAVIDLIRRDEFGLDSSSSGAETSMLRKQHARLGRALQCLSQELYSQDSHFILELVQNADDNRYPEHVEPTLTFILQKTGIVVLNNECGFMPENIRALCDVGRSTKKGSGGYIGKKGIGFKSVFRVSDAPEIHSNGFHFKFDISDGQIGYILPTVVPPHDIESLNSLLSGHALQLKDARWNTCITLPFRTIDSERTTVNHIEPMFSDLHPSLLLFLHRLQCIVYRNMLDDSLLVMRKEVVSENIVNVSCGKNSMTWFVASEKLKAANLRDGIQTTEISIGFTLDMLEDGTYRSCMIQEPVFAFLPLRTYGLKFIIQGDFILTSSREDVDEDSPWNQWLLSEFPSLFVGALRSFCSLPSFTQNPGKAVSSYMQLVPLVGEVHGFFSSLPRSIISRLRTTNCLLLEGDNEQWVPPCKVLRNWNEKISVLLKNGLLQEHLALGFLNKDIVLSDSLSRALGIEDYGPKTLVQILSSLSHKKDCLQSMGFAWLSSILTELYILFRSSGHGNVDLGIDKTLLDGLQKIPFIPLSNGKFTSLDEGAVWLHHDTTGFDLGDVFEAFPMLYGNLRTVDHSFLFASSVDEKSQVDELVNMLCALGVQKLSAHEVIKVLILPAFEAKSRGTLEGLMVDYLCFVMTHLRSGCHVCHSERMYIISELRSKAPILSNYGLKQLAEVTIHFSEEYGNQINMKKVTKNLDILWHVVDGTYLNHPASKYYACGLKEWREFFQEIGIADFVQVVQVEKSIAELCSVSRCEKYDTDLLSPELAVRDWESPELVHLMSLLRKSNGRKCCKHLLGILDKLWDDCYHDKKSVSYNLGTPGVRSSESSFMRLICDSQWIVSSMDNKLHFAKDLYHDCDDVRSILGTNAPYAIPKVTSVKLVTDIGFKTKVCLDDALEILDAWVQCGDSFKSSISEITRFYKFLWNEMADSKQKITEKLHTLPSVFVPHNIGSGQNDQISGIFMSLDDVYWNDSAGVLDEVRGISSQISSVVESLHRKTLCNIYPGLHDFFVNGCGVPEAPSFQEYLNILGHFAHYVSPSCAAKAVFKIFLKWTDDLKSGKSSDDVVHFKKRLSELEYTVLPTENDKWVSLHSSFGLVCWCDDEKLKKRFKKKDNIQFIYFGENSDEEQEMLQTKVSVLMRSFGIPSISEVVKREAKYEGLQDNSITVSLVNWSLPYAQRYIFTLHHEKYSQTRKSVYSQVKRLQVVVVEKLCYRNVIPQYDISSKKEFKCSSLLQDKALYTTPDLDSHSLFMELSRLFFNGVPDLHLANFLHLIKTMAESGLSDEQMESFIVNSQKVHKIPDGEKIWFLKSALKAKMKAGISLSWLPSSSKTGHGSSEAHVDVSNKKLASGQVSSSEEDVTEAPEKQIPIELRDTNLVSGYDNCAGTSLQAKTPNPLHSMHKKSGSSSGNQHAFHLNSNLVHELNNSFFSPDFSERDQLHTGTPWAAQALQTGRKGEEIAYRYFVAKYGKEGLVRWVNEHSETGLPYDLMIENRGGKKEYVEVKATVSTRKDYFNLTVREWQFANEKGESYIIAHVLLGNSNAILTQHRNPVKLCQEGLLRLLVLMPNQRNEINVAF